MPGGIGTIDQELAQGLRCTNRATGLTTRASHNEIYFNLGMDRVHYVPQKQFLYFPQSSYFPILSTLESVYAGLRTRLEIEQFFLDKHGYYKGAQRIFMSAETASAVLVALRLNGIKISIASG
jgi:antirestriction protein ArdC